MAYNGLGQWDKKAGTGAFHGCPVNRCSLTDDKRRAVDADAIIYKDHFSHPGVTRSPNQVWMLYFLECPYHTQNIKYADLFNWTATYRRDSTVVAPYERWTYFDPKVNTFSRNYSHSLHNKSNIACTLIKYYLQHYHSPFHITSLYNLINHTSQTLFL